jgi:putative oxidoreductase
MNQLFRSTPNQINLALLILRIVVGIVFIAHGGQKLFVFGLEGVQGGFTQMGVPLPAITAPLVAILEFAGGMALLVGALTRLVALGLAIDMLGALFLVHLKAGFFLPNGYEFVLVLFAAAAAFFIAGAGAYSVDSVLARRKSGIERLQ